MDGSGVETEIIGRSPAIAQVLRQVAEFSQADVPMIEGETGTGKDVAAWAIHRLRRAVHRLNRAGPESRAAARS